MKNNKEIVTELTNIISNKEYISEMSDTIEKFKTTIGVYLATNDISSYGEIGKLRHIMNTANDIARLINFYI